MHGEVLIDSPIKTGMIRIGFGNVRLFDKRYVRNIWFLEGKVTFKGRARLGFGTKLSVFGHLVLGDNFIVSAHSQIECKKAITFGNNVLIGWDCLFMDSDNHLLLDNQDNVINPAKEILVGDRVWFGARCTVTKGALLGDDLVVAINSNIYRKYPISKCVIGGNPAKVLKTDTTWEY